MFKNIEGYTYPVNCIIGEGQSSIIHKGIKDKTGESIAIKVIKMAKLEDPYNQILLKNEVSALKAITHSKHCLHLHDIFATKNNTYIISQLCQGNLGNIIKIRKTIPYLEAVDIIKQLVLGYIDINMAGYLHRDIHPSNIFYTGKQYKIGDFGFAILKDQANEHKYYNVGSPVYLSPQALKYNEYSVSSDLWSLGIIFYQIIKGTVPWISPSQECLYNKMMNMRIDELSVGLPQSARKLLNKVLSLEPENRLSVNQMFSQVNKLNAVELIKQMPKQNNILTSRNQMNIARVNQDKIKLKKINNENEQKQFKQSKSFAKCLLGYLKLIHRTIEFIRFSQLPLLTLISSLTQHLFKQIQHTYMITRAHSNIVANWCKFLQSCQGLQFMNKLNHIKKKYTTLHQNNEESQCLEICLKVLKRQIINLNTYKLTKKCLILMHLILSIYQLVQLKDKYPNQQVLTLPEVTNIILTDPYSLSEHQFTQIINTVSQICQSNTNIDII